MYPWNPSLVQTATCWLSSSSFHVSNKFTNIRITNIFQLHWSLFLRVQVTSSQPWFRLWLGVEQAISHYLNQLQYNLWWHMASPGHGVLTHWGRVTHICVSDLTNIGSDNGLSPARRQAIIWTNAGILLTGHIWTKFSEILIKIHTSSFKKMHLKMSSGKWRLFRLGLNVLKYVLY